MKEPKIRKKYLLTLFRQGVYFSEVPVRNINGTGDKESCFFSSDYFDKLTIVEIESDAEMSVFIGMKRQKKREQDTDVVAVHNYALFQDVAENEVEYTNNIFDADSRVFPYFALIHVYVNPDVLAGIAEEYYNQNYIERFEENLKEIVEQCKNQFAINAMVFKTLSASDFIIVARSKSPEDVFSISTAVRKKKICKKQKKEESFSVYKTYTILTLNGTGLYVVNEEGGQAGEFGKTGQVAIRGRFSNRYWSQKDGAVKTLVVPDSLSNLSGRYDFLLHLSIEEFWKIYPLLCQAKGIKTGIVFQINNKERKNYSTEILYLYDLIEGNYLSYFNERYLVGNVQEVITESEENEYAECLKEIFLADRYDTSKFLFDSNNDECNKVIEKIDKIRDEIENKQFNRKSLFSSLDLLTNLVYLCQRINGLSDARIYVINLLKQMNTVLDSLNKWIEIYNDKKNDTMLNFMEDYLRQSVVSLDAYGNIIRNNNFQTLQSPRYNVVTGISMEKILIGYSRFLYMIMNYCYKELPMNNGRTDTCYLPVMVPQLSQDTLSVEVVFPEWQVAGGKNKYPKNEYLMIATGPANAEIVDISYIVTTLFHEIAHQLRYEHREERNKVLCRIIIEDLVDSLVQDLFNIVVEVETRGKNTSEFQNTFVKVFSDLVEEAIKDKIGPYKEWSLENYKDAVQKIVQKFLANMKRDNNQVMAMVNGFINDTNEYISNDSDVMKLLIDISKNLQILTGEYKWEDNVEKANFDALLGKGAEVLESFIKERLIKGIKEYTVICQKNNPEMEDDVKVSIERMQEAVVNNIKETKLICKDNKTREKFYNSFYEKICECWKENLKNEKYILGKKKEWIRQGRRFGIDYKESRANKEKFWGYLEKAFNISDKYEFERAMKRIALYREETSDLFMCAFCDLDLISYLSVSAHGYPMDNGHYADGYIERLTDVVLVQWCLESKDDICNLKVEDLCKTELFGGVWGMLNPEDTNTYTDEIELIKQLKGYAEKEENVIKRNVANLSMQILERVGKQISWFRERIYLLEDYLCGKNEYKSLREKFKKEKKYGFKTIIELCEVNKKYLNSLGDADLKLKKSYQRKCEDFILENYYWDKILNVKKEV